MGFVTLLYVDLGLLAIAGSAVFAVRLYVMTRDEIKHLLRKGR